MPVTSFFLSRTKWPLLQILNTHLLHVVASAPDEYNWVTVSSAGRKSKSESDAVCRNTEVPGLRSNKINEVSMKIACA